MRIWRVSNFADLSGQGGLLYPGRWHTAGWPIVYCAESPPGALLEFLVHVSRANLPSSFQLLAIELPDDVLLGDIEQNLPMNWRLHPDTSQGIGDAWMSAGRQLALRVPSAILPHTYNILVNPIHREIDKVRIVSTERVPLDSRFA
jgi:RES domain-containing protein